MKTKSSKVPDSGWRCCKIGHEKFIKDFKKEVTAHFNFIKKNKLIEYVYKYTEGSGKLREDGGFDTFFYINYLIENAPKLEHVYTVYRMSPPFSEISLYTKNGKYIKDSKLSKLKIGDIFTEKKEWVERNTSVMSATYDKSYPLADFTVGINKDEIITMDDVKTYLKLLKKDTFFFHSYFNTEKEYDTYKNAIKELYDTALEDIKEWMKKQIPPVNDDSIFFEDIKKVSDLSSSMRSAKKLYKGIYLEHFFSKLIKVKSCCFFKIKLKNRKGLFIERISKYPQQREILIQNGTRFKVTNITVENYGVIDTSKILKQEEEDEEDDDMFSMLHGAPSRDLTLDTFHNQQGYIKEGAEFPQYKNMSPTLPVKVKKIKVYEIETY